MRRYKTEKIYYPNRWRPTEELVAEGHYYAHIKRNETIEIAAHIYDAAYINRDDDLFEASKDLMREASSPCFFKSDDSALQASDENNRPNDAPTIMDYIAENSAVPKKTNNPRRFTIRDDYKERMLYLLYLTWADEWFICSDGKTKPSVTDVYYWFGILLDYRFDNKTGKLTELFDRGSEKAIHKLSIEMNELSVKLKDMEDNAKIKRRK